MVGIRLEKVSKRFGSTLAVDEISLDIARGDLFFLLGPSGCGKTTILRMIAGFEPPTAGSIFFDDRPINRVPAHRRNTGLVFQNYALWPHMTVEQNVAYGLEERKVPNPEKTERVMNTLTRMHMDAYRHRTPNQLSGGQQQRIALARALVIEPDVVLLDEPLSNLDARLRLDMRQEIRRIHDETGITMVYVTHDQKESLSMADQIAVMSMGKVEQIGRPRTIYRSPASRFVADFIGETNLIPGILRERRAETGRAETALGEVEARLGPDPLQPEDAVLCMIRPECLVVDPSAKGNRFTATMRRNTYLGELEQFELDTPAGPVRAVCANPGDRAPAPESRVSVGFDAADAVLFRASPAESKA